MKPAQLTGLSNLGVSKALEVLQGYIVQHVCDLYRSEDGQALMPMLLQFKAKMKKMNKDAAAATTPTTASPAATAKVASPAGNAAAAAKATSSPVVGKSSVGGSAG